MKNNKQHLWLLATGLFAFLLIAIAVPQLVFHPWNTVPELSSDGGKNIFTFLYHAVYEKGVWFGGMNYPYGEHIVYTDGQPLLSVPLSHLKNITIEQALTLMAWFILASFILAAIYIFKIFTHFGIKPLIALIFAGFAAVFSPQLMWILAHYSLTYSCVMPMLFYWTIKYHGSSGRKYAVYIFILGCLFAFLHPYFAAKILLWVSAYSAGCLIFRQKKLAEIAKHILPLFLSVIAIFAFIKGVMWLTDPYTDRPKVPYGALSSCTSFSDIFFSDKSSIWKLVTHRIPAMKVYQPDEGFCYPGLAVMLVAMTSIVRGIIRVAINRKWTNTEVKEIGLNPIWLFIGFTTLLFSMGVPFVWHMEWLMDYASFLRQFRTLGRFSWIFYYVITIYSVVVINKWYASYRQREKPIAAYSILLIFMAAWLYDASGYMAFVKKRLGYAADNYYIISPDGKGNLPSGLRERKYDPDNFQALLVFKFFEIGSEKLWLGDDFVAGLGFMYAMQMKRPLIDAMMSRTSWSVAEKTVKILGGPYVHKPILDELKNDKPILIIQRETDSLNADEQYLLSASDYIGHFQHCFIYALYPARLRENDKKNAMAVKAILPYIKPGSDSCVTCTGDWYVNHFDQGISPIKLFGSGAVPEILKKDTILATIPIKQMNQSRKYEFSCWFLLSDEDYTSPVVRMELLNSKGNVLYPIDVLTGESTDNNGMWFRSVFYFSMPPDCAGIRLTLINNNLNTYKIMDEMMLRPVDALIISKSMDGQCMVNNHLFKN